MLRVALPVILAVTLSACSDSGGSAPSAPTALTATVLGSGAHLTWKDNSKDEDEFIVMRQQMGVDSAMKEIGTVPFNGVTFHDEPITSGATYLYQVMASNGGGDSASNQVTFVAP